jgi:HD-like signal output (HDOD) protein
METNRLTRPLRDLAAWTAFLRTAEIPVLAQSAGALEDLRSIEDDVDANMIGETFSSDPLMTLRILAHLSTHRPARVVTQPETVTASVVMMGITPFFKAFSQLPSVEETLQDLPEALEGLREVLRRSHRAADFALGFAVHRLDHDAAVIHHAALLHDFAEMLLWLHAPELALRIRDAQRADSTLRSNMVQKEVLNVTLQEMAHSLMLAWRLPELLMRITDDQHAEHPSARSVLLAIRLARHTAKGWENAALPDDIRDIATLLNISESATTALVHELDS